MNNFFITGDKAVGKTTIVKKILVELNKKISGKSDKKIAGFITARITDSKSGRPLLFELRPAEELRESIEIDNIDNENNLINIELGNTKKENTEDNNARELINALSKNINKGSELEEYFAKNYFDNKRIFAFRKDPYQKFTVREEVFNNFGAFLLSQEAELLVMDELGRFELNAEHFKKEVFKILDSEKIVLGTIKAESNSFLDKIRERNDVKIFWVTTENRDKIYQKVYKLVKEAFRKM